MNLITIGKVQSIFGLKGAVKIYSWTAPKENIFTYKNWQLDFLETRKSQQEPPIAKSYKLLEGKPHKKGLLAFLEGVADAENAQSLIGAYIKIEQSQLPKLAKGEYYWSDLIGLQVIDLENNLLGQVKNLLETGANDCLVLAPTKASIDGKERLIPYLEPEFIKKIDVKAGLIQVDWDKDF